jgi:hypothetical protein
MWCQPEAYLGVTFMLNPAKTSWNSPSCFLCVRLSFTRNRMEKYYSLDLYCKENKTRHEKL